MTAHLRYAKAPEGLGEAGNRLWLAVVSEYRLTSPEKFTLTIACRQADLVESLEVLIAREGVVIPGSRGERLNPTVIALGPARVRLTRLIDGLHLPMVDTDDAEDSPELPEQADRSRRASVAAKARWQRV